ncbi:MAG TPA: DUF1427 family protein [Telluria sp.]|nr:DUF1427 family protein [Telluria sp.]
MKVYLISLAAGMLAGLLYSLLNVRSPAPPAIALVGLLGMLLGEQIVPMVKHAMAGESITIGWLRSECVPKITGVTGQPAAPEAVTAAKAAPPDDERPA